MYKIVEDNKNAEEEKFDNLNRKYRTLLVELQKALWTKSNFVSTGFIKSPHQTIIIEDPTKMQKTGKALVTPFAIAADIVLLPITLPLFVYQQVKESQTPHFCQGEFCGYDKLKSDNSSKKKSNFWDRKLASRRLNKALCSIFKS